MSTEISAKIRELPYLRTRQLRMLWEELFAKPPHPKLRRDLMIPILAYQVQESAYGGLKASTRRRLEKLAAELERNPSGALQSSVLKPGTKLIRHWHGERHEVLANDEGFDYRGKRYKSLSEIAREITDARWSGPRFFGIRQARKTRAAQ